MSGLIAEENRRKSLRSLLYLLTTVADVEEEFILAYSLGSGYFLHRLNGRAVLPRDVRMLKSALEKAVANERALPGRALGRAEAQRHFSEEMHTLTSRWIEDAAPDAITYAGEGQRLQAFDGPLWEHAGQVGAWDLIPYPPGMILRLPRNGNDELEPHREHPRLFRAFYEGESWGRRNGVFTVSDVNELVRAGTVTELIALSEAWQERRIAAIGDKIMARQPRPAVVLISGPSSSGKTSFSKRLRTHLRLHRLKPHAIGLDDYYLPREQVPRTPSGDYDYEILQALDIELFNETLLRLVSGERVALPRLDFKTHTRVAGEEIGLDEDGILIVEGIHALNPGLTPHLTTAMTFRIYISALTHLNFDGLNRMPTTDLRLIRRMVRDRRDRGYTVADTLQRWKAVHAAELKYIFPHQEQADVMFNSAIAFELHALKEQAMEALEEVEDPEMAARVARLRNILSAVEPIDHETVQRHLPSSSLLREFFGGGVLT